MSGVLTVPDFIKGGKIMEELIKIISNVGFPIAISAYLLIRIENKLEILSSSIGELAKALEILKGSL